MNNEIIEIKEIAITGKRQVTIPKSYYEKLRLDDTLIATLLPNSILLENAKKRETVSQEDMREILNDLIKEGLDGEELIEEFSKRAKRYNEFLKKKVEQWNRELAGEDDSECDVEDDYNGLEMFFDK